MRAPSPLHSWRGLSWRGVPAVRVNILLPQPVYDAVFSAHPDSYPGTVLRDEIISRYCPDWEVPLPIDGRSTHFLRIPNNA